MLLAKQTLLWQSECYKKSLWNGSAIFRFRAPGQEGANGVNS